MNNDIDKWFGPIASIIVVTAIAFVGIYMGQQEQLGKFPWWPYPAFTLLVITIFTVYGYLSREKN
jgi:fatty acid desaturase